VFNSAATDAQTEAIKANAVVKMCFMITVSGAYRCRADQQR